MNKYFQNFIFLISLFIFQARAAGKTDEKAELDYEIWDLMDSCSAAFGSGINWYELFGVEEAATTADIQKSYRKLSFQFHPDKNPSKEAEKKFQILAGVAKILKDEGLRQRYDYWLVNEIPYWRGRAYYFRKGENLSLLQTTLVILIAASIMQYASMFVRYSQVKSGMKLLGQRRELIAATRNPTNSPLPKKAKQAIRKRRYSEEALSSQSHGIFDDANMKQALDWLVIQHKIAPEVVFDLREWKKMIEKDFGGDESKFRPDFPSPLSTIFFLIPFWLFAKIFSKSNNNNNNNSNSNNNNENKVE